MKCAPRLRIALLVLIAVVAGARAAPARVRRASPILVRVEGFVGEKPRPLRSLARWVVAINGAQYSFHVTRLQPIGTDIAFWNILNQLEPLPVTLTLYGEPDLLRQFAATPPGQPIGITGVLQLGPGPVTLLLRAVEPLPTSSPSPTVGATAPAAQP